MKKFILAVGIIASIFCFFSNIYATNIINDTRNNLVNIYDDITDNTLGNMNNTDLDNNNNNSTMESVLDGLSIIITIGAITTIAGVIFYYLVPKK